ncbi:TonB-dependent receptor [Sphingobacterium spiritivorum]|uniref:TonB-dependent receptor n=1 Tax=Sphingobacterium spiritivorum TaxID=258 RepID=UPI003DA3DCF2
MIKRVIAILLLCTAYSLSFAQTSCPFIWTGQIQSAITKLPVANATVILQPAGRSVMTDAKGYYRLTSVCAGTYTLHISSVGYEAFQSDQIVLSKDKSQDFTLRPSNIHLDDVEVVGVSNTALSGSKHRLSAQDLSETKGKLLGDALSRIAGVTTLSTGSSIVKPVINGLHSNRILVLNNGIRQEGQQWGSEHAPEIDPFTADKIEVIKGAQAVRYGADALGGVVVTTPAALDYNKVFGGRLDLVGESNGRGGTTSAMLEGNTKALPGLAWRVQASGKKLGNIRTASYYLGNTGVEELNFSGQLQYRLKSGHIETYFSRFGTNLGIFRGAHVGTREDIYTIIENGRPLDQYDFSYTIEAPRQQVTHDLAKVKWQQQLSASGTMEVQYGYQRNHRREYDLRRVEADDLPMADMSLTTQSLDVLYRTPAIQFGLNGVIQINNNKPGTGTTPIIPNYDNHSIGVFGLTQFHHNSYHFEVGLRYDYRYFDAAGYRYDYRNPNADGTINQKLYSGTRTFHNVSGTAGLLYHITPSLNWKSNIGLAWRAPSANELYSDGLHHGSGIYEVGNPDMKSEKGVKWVNSLLYNPGKIDINMDIYAQYIYDYIYAVPNPDSVRQTIRGTFPVYSYQQHNAFFYGLDIKAAYHISDYWQYDLAFSAVRAKNTSLNTYLPFIPSDRVTQSIQWNLVSAKWAQKPYVKLSHRYVARQDRFEADMDYVAPPPAYHLVDLYTGASWAIGKQQLHLTLSAENLMNKLYKDYMDTFRYYAHRAGRNISFRVAYQF